MRRPSWSAALLLAGLLAASVSTVGALDAGLRTTTLAALTVQGGKNKTKAKIVPANKIVFTLNKNDKPEMDKMVDLFTEFAMKEYELLEK